MAQILVIVPLTVYILGKRSLISDSEIIVIIIKAVRLTSKYVKKKSINLTKRELKLFLPFASQNMHIEESTKLY